MIGAKGRHEQRVMFSSACGKRQSNSKVGTETVHSTISFPTVRDLLATGFLEGVPVIYVSKKHKVELHGFIKDDGYQCGCTSCNYTRVLSAKEFEKHAGVSSSFANDHIILENGISLNELVKHLVNTPYESLHRKLEVLTDQTIDLEVYDAWLKESSQVGNPRHAAKQNRVLDTNLSQESPPDLRTQLHLGTSFQKKRPRSARRRPRSPDPTKDTQVPLEPTPPRTETKRARACLSDGADSVHPFPDKKPRLSPGPVPDELLHVPSEGSQVVALNDDSLSRDVDHRCQEGERCAEAPQAKDFSPSTPYKKSEAKNAKKLDVKRFLSTGLLEGFPVTYKFKKANVELRGIIKDCGYLCGCSSCNFSRVISALEFEKHAGAATTNQNHHILLENGLSVYNLIKELKTVPLDSLSQVLEKRVGRGANSKCYDLWKELYQMGSEELQERCVYSEGNEQIQQEPFNEPYSVRRSPQRPDLPDMLGPPDRLQEKVSVPDGLENMFSECPDLTYMPGPTDPLQGKVAVPDALEERFPECPDLIFMPGQIDPLQEKVAVLDGSEERSSECPDLLYTPGPTDILQAKVAISDGSEKSISPRSPLSPDQPYLPSSPVYFQQQTNAAQCSSKKRNHYLHDLIFKENGLPNGTALAYITSGQIKLTGYKSEYGIVCDCCNQEISPSKFEAHAGFATRRQPYRNIYPIDGDSSLHQLSLFLSKGEKFSVTENWCRICGEEEDLVSCNGCTASFHSYCLENYTPCSKWCCPYCERSQAASTSTSDADRQYSRLRRVLEAPNDDHGGCVLCKDGSFSLGEFNAKTIILCDQCEKEYHVGCLKYHSICDLKERPSRKWFCCADCDRIHAEIRKFVFNGPMMVPVSLLSIMERKVEERRLIDEAGAHMQWRVLSGQYKPLQYKLLLETIEVIRSLEIYMDGMGTWRVHDDVKEAQDLGTIIIFRSLRKEREEGLCADGSPAYIKRNFRNCYKRDGFYPIRERQHDLIPAMVYSRETAGQAFQGMYCVVLTVKSVVVSAGVLRIFGKDVAELPLVATSKKNQGKGYFPILLSLIESFLSQLNVEVLTLSAADNDLPIWINKFGFVKMTAETVKKYADEVPILMFQKTTVLEKAVPHISSSLS